MNYSDIKLNDALEAYRLLSRGHVDIARARRAALVVSAYVCSQVTAVLEEADTLVVFILRGALLMLPSAYECFVNSTFGLLGMKREGDTSKCNYRALPNARKFTNLVIVDSVIGSGETILSSRNVLEREGFSFEEVFACFIVSSKKANERLRKDGWHTYGFSDNEHVINGMVIPDFGSRDAGDMAIGDTCKEFPAKGFFRECSECDERRLAREELIYHPIIDFVKDISPSTLLDVGCGDGSLDVLLAPHVGKITAFDTNYEAIEMARKNSCRHNIEFYTSEIKEYMGAEFDCLVCSMVLNVVDDCDSFVRQAVSCCSSDSTQLWAILHPAFQYNRSLWLGKQNITLQNETITYQVTPSYFDHSVFCKSFGKNTELLERHRPISYYFNLFIDCGLKVIRIVEPRRSMMTIDDGYRDYIYPKILIFVTRKK